MGHDNAAWRIPLSYSQQQRDQQQIFKTVIENNRVSESIDIGKLYAAPDIRGAADNLAVDKVAYTANSHDVCCCNGQDIANVEKVYLVISAKYKNGDNGSKQNSMG